MSEPESPETLAQLLERWGQSTPSAPSSIEPEVWRRIELAERSRPAPGWMERVHAAFARPSFAAAFVAACVLLGLFLAEVRSSRLQARYGAQLAQNYLHLIDPLLGDEAKPLPAIKP